MRGGERMRTERKEKEKEMTRELLRQKGYDPFIIEAADGFVLAKASEQDEPLLLLYPESTAYVLRGLPSMADAVLVSKKALVTVPRRVSTVLDPTAFFLKSLKEARQCFRRIFIARFKESELERFLSEMFEALAAGEVFEEATGMIKGPRGTVIVELRTVEKPFIARISLEIHYWRLVGGVLVGIEYRQPHSIRGGESTRWEVKFQKGPEVRFFSDVYERFKKAVERLVKRSVAKVKDAREGAIYYLTERAPRSWDFTDYVYFEGKAVKVRTVLDLKNFVEEYAGADEVTRETLRQAFKKAVFEGLKGD